MFKTTIGSEVYSVDFRHKTTEGKRAQLSRRSPIKAITTCVVSTTNFVAIDNAICVREDQFSRWSGRSYAFEHLIQNCKALKDDVREALVAKFYELNPEPTPQAERVTIPMPKEEKQRRISAGAELRAKRAANNSVKSATI